MKKVLFPAFLIVCVVSSSVVAFAVDTPPAVPQEIIPYNTEIIEDNTQFSNYKQVVQVGQDGIVRIMQQQGVPASGTSGIEKKIVKEPVTEIIIVGTQESEVSTPLEKDDFIRPLDTGYISNKFRSKSHPGIDIAAKKGTNIVASAAGRVSFVKYGKTGYGYYLKIDHGNGVETLYAHNNEIFVEEGDWVEQGDIIASVGRTGRATGNHVQFEIRVNGKAVNPQDYV